MFLGQMIVCKDVLALGFTTRDGQDLILGHGMWTIMEPMLLPHEEAAAGGGAR